LAQHHFVSVLVAALRQPEARFHIYDNSYRRQDSPSQPLPLLPAEPSKDGRTLSRQALQGLLNGTRRARRMKTMDGHGPQSDCRPREKASSMSWLLDRAPAGFGALPLPGGSY
jgi:hypothetical protein